MDPKPSGIENKTLMRAGLAGLLLGAVLVGLFVGIWVLMGELGAADFPRLFTAICIPPALVSAAIGIILLVVRPSE